MERISEQKRKNHNSGCILRFFIYKSDSGFESKKQLFLKKARMEFMARLP